jgi:hypothetical protein
MIKQQLEAHKEYCKVNNLKPQDYKNLKEYNKEDRKNETLCYNQSL